MQNEFEIKFLNIHREDLIQKLLLSGFRQDFPETLFFRSIFHPATDPLGQKTRARVRKEGDKVLMNVKNVTNDINSVNDTYEAEIVVENYQDAENFLVALGLIKIQEAENTREQYSLDNVMVCIDQYPGIPPYCEIEGPSEEALQKTAATLGFAWDEAFGAAPMPYVCEKLLGIPVAEFFKIKSITFANPLQGKHS